MGAVAKDSTLLSVLNKLSYERVKINIPKWNKGQIVYSNGTVAASDTSSGRYTDMIELDANASHLQCLQYTAGSTSASVAFYNSEQKYLKGYYAVDAITDQINAPIIEIPHNAKYVRFGVYATRVSEWWGEYFTGTVISAIERLRTATLWRNDSTRVMNNNLRSTSAVYTDSIRVQDSAMVSIRVVNSLDQMCKIALVDDIATGNTNVMLDSTGNAMQFDCQAGQTTIITPDDMPQLKYLDWLKLRVNCITAPTSGSVKVYAYVKR